MLSYGYTLLVHEAVAALETAGLDPMVGYLHQHRWGRPALALDLMEEFRPNHRRCGGLALPQHPGGAPGAVP